MQLKYRVLQ